MSIWFVTTRNDATANCTFSSRTVRARSPLWHDDYIREMYEYVEQATVFVMYIGLTDNLPPNTDCTEPSREKFFFHHPKKIGSKPSTRSSGPLSVIANSDHCHIYECKYWQYAESFFPPTPRSLPPLHNKPALAVPIELVGKCTLVFWESVCVSSCEVIHIGI